MRLADSDERPDARESVLQQAAINPWSTLEATYAYRGKMVAVRLDNVVAPDGSRHAYEYVELNRDFATIAAIDDQEHVYMVRQWRYPWDSSSWEIPAGGMEPGETPLECAQRELLEEAGLKARNWTPLGTFRTSASMTVRGHIFLAQGLVEDQTRREGTEEDMIVQRLPLSDAVAAVSDGHVHHGLSALGLVLALRHIEAQMR